VLANYFVHEALESDVQETHLAKMELSKDGKDFLVEDERQVRYVVDLEKRSFQILKWAVKTKIVEFKPGPKGWSYWVELTVTNSLNRELLLDGISVASDGSVDNNIFRVKVNGAAVEYQDEPCKALREGLYSSCSGCDLASDVQVFDLTGRSAADSKRPAPK
jgi:hypothetical protein